MTYLYKCLERILEIKSIVISKKKIIIVEKYASLRKNNRLEGGPPTLWIRQVKEVRLNI